MRLSQTRGLLEVKVHAAQYDPQHHCGELAAFVLNGALSSFQDIDLLAYMVSIIAMLKTIAESFLCYIDAMREPLRPDSHRETQLMARKYLSPLFLELVVNFLYARRNELSNMSCRKSDSEK